MMVEIDKLESAAEMLKAIAHPLRIGIVSLLTDNERLMVTEIHEALKIEQAVASHHLGIMKNKGVLICEKEGKNNYYKLKYPRLSKIVKCIDKCQDEL